MRFGHLHFSEHEKLQCPQLAKAITQKRPCQFGRNSEPTKSFSYTYLLRVLPQISFSSQAKGFAPNEDKSFAPGISAIQTRQVVALTQTILFKFYLKSADILPHLHILFWLTDFLLPKCCHETNYNY